MAAREICLCNSIRFPLFANGFRAAIERKTEEIVTRADRDLFRGWQAADKGLPIDPHQSPEWLEGYLLRLKSKKRS